MASPDQRGLPEGTVPFNFAINQVFLYIRYKKVDILAFDWHHLWITNWRLMTPVRINPKWLQLEMRGASITFRKRGNSTKKFEKRGPDRSCLVST